MVSQQIVDIIIKAEDQASAAAKKVDTSFQNLKNRLNNSLSRIPGFDTLRTKVSGVASTLRTKLGGAVDGVRSKLQSLANGSKSAASALNFLKGAASMAVGMIGYDLVNAMVENTRASLNARSSLQAFASRLGMSASEVDTFQASLDNLQNTYKKIDMDVVGQQATDMAYRLGLPKESLTELTETTAIFSDAMQRNGRSAEDSMLAMSDAMDGQFVRLKEIGIGQEDLMRNGWSGDINDKTGLLQAMNKALKEQHYDELAKSVDSLDDAWQVLSITLSNLLEAILLPLTPVIVQIVTGFTDALNAVKPFIQTLQGAAGALPQWLQDAGWAVVLTVALGYLAQVIMLSIVPALASAALAALDFAAAMLANPFTWVLIALVAIAYAIYEIGKAFGWWTDVNSMIQAVWAGIQRLWSAFINHPDVQAAIQMISSALSTLWNWIVQAGQAVLDFFGINSSGNFDIVRALIDAVGATWNTLSGIIGAVVGVLTAAGEAGNATADAFSGFWNDTLVPFGTWLSSVFAPVWQLIGDLINAISPFVTNLSNAFTMFANGQMSLPDLIWTVLTTLFNAYVTIFSMIISRVASWGRSIINRGISSATSFVTGIISRIMALPGRVYSQLMTVVGRVRSAIQSWISAAVNKVNELINNVTSTLSGLPGKISSALSGVVDAIVSPFKNAYDKVVTEVDKIKNKVSEVSGGLIAFGGETAYGGEVYTSSTTTVGSDTVNVNENINLTLDFQNVPEHLDTDTLVSALTNRDVLRAFVGNKDFQDMDLRVKNQIASKTRRYNGV